MVKIKICGLRRAADIEAANALLPDYVGFVFAQSRRKVIPKEAAVLRQTLDGSIGAVGVFVNAEITDVAKTAALCKLCAVQLHGDEDGGFIQALRPMLPEGCEIWKAARISIADDLRAALTLDADRLLFDAFSPDARGGTGQRFDWSLLKSADIRQPFFVAGGITPDNAAEAVAAASGTNGFCGLDVSGGVETDGYKDYDKMKRLIDAVRMQEV